MEKILSAVVAQSQIGVDDGFDGIDDPFRREAAPGDVADRAALVGAAAQCQLVALDAGLFQAEDPDVADVVVAAGVNAARDLDLEVADLSRPLRRAEALGDSLRHRNRSRGRQRAIIEARAADDVADEPDVLGGEAVAREAVVDRREILERHVGQHDVLLVRDAQLVVRIALREIGHVVHLRRRGVAGDAADRLQRDREHAVARHLVREDVAGDEAAEGGVVGLALLVGARLRAPSRQVRHREIGDDAVDFVLRQGQAGIAVLREIVFDGVADRVGALLVDEDLDARLVLVVAAPLEIVHAQDRVRVGEQVGLGQKLADAVRDQRRAALAAADIDGEADLTRLVAHHLVADVVHLDRGAVGRRAGHRDLELARQEREFRMQRRPLPNDLGIGAWILDLVGGGAGELVGRGVADAISRGLDAVHLNRGEIRQDRRDVLQRGPIVLQVLTCGEMAVTLVVGARDVGEHAHLLRGQRAVGHGDAQHVGVKLQVDAVHQP